MSIRDQLWNVAVDQYGFVTADDATNLGVRYRDFRKLADRGSLSRAAHGIYRFDDFPSSANDAYMLAALWTAVPAAALSHDTALELYELCDVNPGKIHLTVPRYQRIRRAGGDDYVIHTQDLKPDQIGWWQGIRAVTEKTAIEQGIESHVPVHLLDQAIRTALARGRISASVASELRHRQGVLYGS